MDCLEGHSLLTAISAVARTFGGAFTNLGGDAKSKAFPAKAISIDRPAGAERKTPIRAANP